MIRLRHPLGMGGIVIAFAFAWASYCSLALAQTPKFDPSIRPDFSEPVVLASKDGVLEVRLIAKQGEARLDTVGTPVQNMLVFAYELIRGTASNGRMSGDNLYPSPTLQVFPGETLIVHLDNALTGLTIRDFFDPQYTAKGEEVPLYPAMMTSSPLNLHVHGVHVSPKGNADNVMLHIPGGMSNTYTYNIPKNMPQGAYWYHSHLHGLTTPHVYYGMAGLLAIGRTDGNLPLVTQNQIPIRNMVLQYNYVFDRAGGSAQLNNYSWSQWVSTIKPPEPGELEKGTYRPLLAPVNFLQSKPGTQSFTIWYAGPLSIRNERGRFEFIPSNLQRFTAFPGGPGKDVPADPSLPDYQRDVQFTINGQFQPVIESKANQTEIWVLANVSDIAYMPVQLTETATGNHPKIAIVGQDGVPYPEVHHPVFENGTRLLIPPASRYAVAVTMPADGDLILEMPPRGGGATTISAPGVLYTNNGTENPPATLGSLSVLPSAVSYYDGFFVSPTQILARATISAGNGVATAFNEGQKLGAYTVYEDISQVKPDVERELVISGGFLDNLASLSDPKAFMYVFAGIGFPNAPLLQPRLGPDQKSEEHRPRCPEGPLPPEEPRLHRLPGGRRRAGPAAGPQAEGLRHRHERPPAAGQEALPQLLHHRPPLPALPRPLRQQGGRGLDLPPAGASRRRATPSSAATTPSARPRRTPSAATSRSTRSSTTSRPSRSSTTSTASRTSSERVIRTIGDPAVRFREDPVRMLRAVALAARLGFTIDRDTVEAIRVLRGEIVKSSPARLLEEIYKILRQGALAARPSRCCTSTGLLAYLLPEADRAIAEGGQALAGQPGAARRLTATPASRRPTSSRTPLLMGTLLVPLGVPLRRVAVAPRRGASARRAAPEAAEPRRAGGAARGRWPRRSRSSAPRTSRARGRSRPRCRCCCRSRAATSSGCGSCCSRSGGCARSTARRAARA